MKIFLKWCIALLIIFGTAGAVFWLRENRPISKKERPRPTIPVVAVSPLLPVSEHVFIEAAGEVTAARQLDLAVQVGGRIVWQHSELAAGGMLRQGEVLARIDPAEYDLAIREALTAVTQAESLLEQEKGRQQVAAEEWRLFATGQEASGGNADLALRKPQIIQAEAAVEAARSRLAAARLDRERTDILVPFNAVVLQSFVEQGQFVDARSPLARLVDSDLFRVQVTVPLAVVARIRFAEGRGESAGSAVRVMLDPGGGAEIERHGVVSRLLADLEPSGRMARVLVDIADPLGLGGTATEAEKNGRILLGSYVRVAIDAGIIDAVYRIPRTAVRDRQTVWLLTADNSLAIRPLSVFWRRQDELLATMEMNPGDRLITSRLQAPLPGMSLRALTDSQADGQGAANTGAGEQ